MCTSYAQELVKTNQKLDKYFTYYMHYIYHGNTNLLQPLRRQSCHCVWPWTRRARSSVVYRKASEIFPARTTLTR